MSGVTPLNEMDHFLILNQTDGSPCVRIPEGAFEMGDGKDANCPRHTVYLDTYYIGLYPVTNRQYQRFVRATGHRKPDQADWGDPVWKNDEFPEAKADHPVVCVSWNDALAYCRWAGGDLPTEAQREKAARGPEGFLYPWGDEWDPNRCRHDDNKGPENTCSIYDYPESASGYGVYHMAGNVWEWCGDWYDSDYYQQSPAKNPTGPDLGPYRVNRGGGWYSSFPTNFRSACRGDDAPSLRIDFLGFRILLIRR